MVVDQNSKQRFIPYDAAPERRFVSADPNVKELIPLREDLHEMIQCYRRQHCAASKDLHEHPRRHSSWKESTRMKFMNVPPECSKRRSESSTYMWKTTGALQTVGESKIALESYIEERAQKTLAEKFEEDHVVEYVQSDIDGDDSEGAS